MAENQHHFPQRPPPLNLNEIFGVDQAHNWNNLIVHGRNTPPAPPAPQDGTTPPSQIEESSIIPESHQTPHSIP